MNCSLSAFASPHCVAESGGLCVATCQPPECKDRTPSPILPTTDGVTTNATRGVAFGEAEVALRVDLGTSLGVRWLEPTRLW